MGLKYGAQKLIEKLKYGLYNNQPEKYVIYVDGELMRYKGLVSSNLSCHNACEAIANTSFDYMMNMVKNIEFMLSCSAKKIIVFMDGARVNNKMVRPNRSQFDTDLIRNLFKSKCFLNNVIVHELVNGESELQMYLKRDRSNNLNVFLTSDSDMIAILYSHTPTITDKYGNNIKYSDLEFKVDNENFQRISNNNQVYSQKNIKIKDSCLWINCSYQVIAIGCDFNSKRMIFDPTVFLTMIGMCGTDFTDSILTETMIQGILRADINDINEINCMTDLHCIAALLIFIAIKNGGTIRPMQRHRISCGTRSFDDFVKNLQYYINYIQTGVMTDEIIVDVNTPLLCRDILNLLGFQGTTYRKSQLLTWANMITMEEALTEQFLS
ncbi:hypothetical protein [Drosophila suzukii associated hytrosavirus 1]|nr:hypothetical protein [Drosophila suzukii associated hytrosavirus 1]